MSRVATIVLSVSLSVIAAYATVKIIAPASVSEVTPKESTYDRVMRTGELRCGYTPYSIGLMRDPNSGKLSGIYADVIEELAKNLSLKVTWVEEVGWGAQIAGLNSNRYDMICSPASLNSTRAREADFSLPLYYSPVQIWARKGAERLADLSAINRKETRISVIDGEQTAVFARNYFPLAQAVSLPQNAQFSELLLQVTTGKADVTFAETYAVNEFMENNPNSLHQVSQKPLVIVPNIILIKRDEYAFKQLIDNGLRELFNTGFIERAIDKYEKYPNSYVRETTLR